jgi:PLP dependent protein
MNLESLVAERIAEVRGRMAAAAARGGRPADSVRLVAVTKTYPLEAVLAAVASGCADIGENRVQEAVPKIEAFRASQPGTVAHFHLIGHLQSNKARHAVRFFDLIHSVDSEHLAVELDRHAQGLGKTCRVLLQVNVSGEETKSGFTAETVTAAFPGILDRCPNLRVAGFMTMAPLVADPELTRPVFRNLRELRDLLLARHGGHASFVAGELSMGMTNDYEVAIEEGATLVRIGSAIFGSR